MYCVMVVGASGMLGNSICMELKRLFNNEISLVGTDYQTARGQKTAESFGGRVAYRYLDVAKEATIEKAIEDVDLVIVAVKQKEPLIQKLCIQNQIPSIDVTPFSDFTSKVKALHKDSENNNTATIIMSGFFPGLSGLMVEKAASSFQDLSEIHVGLLQNTNAKAGITGILDMLAIISQAVPNRNNSNEVVPGFKQKRTMPISASFAKKEVRLIEHAEKQILQERFKSIRIDYWTAWNSGMFNRLIALLKQLRILTLLVRNRPKFLSKIVKNNPRKNENAHLSVEVKGKIAGETMKKELVLSTFSDYQTTAMVTAALAKITMSRKDKGVLFPFEITTVDEVLDSMDCKEVVLEERKFTLNEGNY